VEEHSAVCGSAAQEITLIHLRAYK